jgi:endonuclease/exonuclease/phosphatase family metal-dependent hydrolase
VLLIAISFAGSCRAENNSEAKQLFRVMTYNIHHGEGLDGKLDLERIAALIKSERADIVALQEVDKGTQRTKRLDFPALLSKLTGMTCVFSNNLALQGGEYGNAILTRFPVKTVTNLHLRKLKEGEQRGLLQTSLDINGQPLTFMGTHLDHRRDDAERLASVVEISSILSAGKGMPVILCGDFNDVPGGKMYHALSEILVDSWSLVGQGPGPTIPADKPSNRIDYIWVSKSSPFKPIKAWIPSTEASDHLPVVVEFEQTSNN